MNLAPGSVDSFIVPYSGIHLPDGFEVCWAGEAPVGLCLGSVDGKLLFTDQEGRRLGEPKKASMSGAAINGVALLGPWVAISTPEDVNFFSFTERQGGLCLPKGAHGIATTLAGYFIAPLGRNGILSAKPPFGGATSLTAHTPGDETLYVYRVVSLRSKAGVEVLACAARLGGVIAGEFSGSQETQTMNTAKFKDLDIVDICPLCQESNSLAVAALCRDGSLILFRDVLNDKKPKTFKFQTVKGTAYRILSCQGDIYVLTSKGLFILAKLGIRFASGEQVEGVSTPILPLPMEAIDMNLARRGLLVVLADEVRKFDVDVIHDHGEGDIEAFQPDIVPIEAEWRNVESAMEALHMAG